MLGFQDASQQSLSDLHGLGPVYNHEARWQKAWGGRNLALHFKEDEIDVGQHD